jgi:acetyl-CoA acetyltransferase
MNLIALADRLHKTIEEIEEISVTELNEWAAFYQLRAETKE